MKIAIVGYGLQGKAAYEYWNKPENEITICDHNELQDLPQDAKTSFGTGYLDELENFDLIVRSPAVHPSALLASNPDHPEILSKITTVTDEFFKVCPTKNIIGVTGTKGKGTTSTLISHLLQTAGHRVHLGGNIGTPPLELLKDDIKPDDWVVLELANFQLIDLKHSPKIAVCLMVVPEHLDWHRDMYEYILAKQQLFTHQQPDDLAIYNARNLYSEEVVGASHAHNKLAYDVPPPDMEPLETHGAYVENEHIKILGQEVCKTRDVALLGRHNLENVCAAISATWHLINQDKLVVQKVVKNFAGLPHRLEIVDQVKGVWYVNDSFGTTPETAIVAIDSFTQPKVLIVGGSDKGADYHSLAATIVKSDVHHVIAIGETGPKILQLMKQFPNNEKTAVTVLDETKTMPDIVATAKQFAKKGDVVLLSTGSASFGMFANYKDRGDQFRTAVKALVAAAQ